MFLGTKRKLVPKSTSVRDDAGSVRDNVVGRDLCADVGGVGPSVSPKRQCVRASVASSDEGLRIPEMPTVGPNVCPATCVGQLTPPSHRHRRPSAIGKRISGRNTPDIATSDGAKEAVEVAEGPRMVLDVPEFSYRMESGSQCRFYHFFDPEIRYGYYRNEMHNLYVQLQQARREMQVQEYTYRSRIHELELELNERTVTGDCYKKAVVVFIMVVFVMYFLTQ
ncbi:hypothetical protein Tco_0374928 [Tanacetum coccineum]